MSDPVTALAAIGQALGIVKTLNEIGKDFDVAAYKLQVAELASTLADAKIEMLEIHEEIAARDAEIARLEQVMAKRGNMVEQKGFKYDKQEDGSPVGLPYCPRCAEADNRFMRLAHGYGKHGKIQGCPQCKSEFRAAELLPKKPESEKV